MRLILLRHGNTFKPGETAVWVGKREDLPLVEQGRIQAERAAGVLQELGVLAQGLYCSSLKRTREFAKILKKNCHWKASVVEDPRLDELDYGLWSGLSSEDIAARGWVIDLQQWNDRCVWPEQAGWEGSAELIRSEVQDFVDDLRQTYDQDATVVAVTSNGRMRYFLSLDPESFREAVACESVKVKTGHAAIFEVGNSAVTLKAWNLSPEDLAAVLTTSEV